MSGMTKLTGECCPFVMVLDPTMLLARTRMDKHALYRQAFGSTTHHMHSLIATIMVAVWIMYYVYEARDIVLKKFS